MKSAAAVLLMVICGIGLTVIEKEESAPEYIHSSCSSSDLDVGARLLDSGKYQPEIRFAGDYNDLVFDVTRENAVDIAVMFHDEFGRIQNSNGDAMSVSTGDPDEDPIVVIVPKGANGLNVVQLDSSQSKRIAVCVIEMNKKFNK